MESIEVENMRIEIKSEKEGKRMRVLLKTVGEKNSSRLLLFVVSFINKSYQNLSLYLFFVDLFIICLLSQTVRT